MHEMPLFGLWLGERELEQRPPKFTSTQSLRTSPSEADAISYPR